MELQFAVLLGFGALSVLLYISVLVTLVSPRHGNLFAHSFYRLITAIGFIDLCSCVHSYIAGRLPANGFFLAFYRTLDNSFAVTVFLFFNFYFLHAQFFGAFFLSLNRFTAVGFPVFHRRFWKRALPFAIAVIFLLPLTLTAHNFAYKAFYFNLTADGSKMAVNYVKTPYTIRNSLITMIASFVFVPSCFLLNFATFLFYLRMRRSIKRENAFVRSQFSLLLISVCTFVTQSLIGVYQILMFLFKAPHPISATLYSHSSWIVDLGNLSAPWILMIASTIVRGKVFALFHPRSTLFKKQKVSAVSVRSR